MVALKVPKEDYAEIVRLYEEEGLDQEEIGRRYGVVSSRICQIISIYKADYEAPDFPHGTIRGFNLGCKCQRCKVAGRRASRETNRRANLFQDRRRWLRDDE